MSCCRENGASRELSNVVSRMQTTGSPAHQPPLFPSATSAGKMPALPGSIGLRYNLEDGQAEGL